MSRSHPAGRAGAVGLALVGLAVPLLALTPTPAHAADRTPFIVVGTSDVADSGLMSQVIEPGFEAAYPQYDLQYVAKGTGAAIAYAEAGTASALIVHAASLENQFVGQGYSLESYGRALTWGDYVLLGPKSADPAGVLSTDGTPSHDIVGAYQKVAAAGAAGTANFVSRGGTPGTTVQEHSIWALTSGVPTCDVTAANGGGKAPFKTGGSGTCGTSTSNPSWYQTTGLNQGPNLVNADTCNYSGGNCYVFTDKGTFEYLRSQGANGGVQDLRIVAQNNTVTGQENLLINSFHVYGINPAKFPGTTSVDPVAAQDFLNWSTSSAAQSAIGSYLSTDVDGAPFRPSASPRISLTGATGPDATVPAGTKLTFNGSVTNVVPGTPALSGVPVHLTASLPGSTTATTVASGTTDASGAFSISYTAQRTLTYAVTTDQISQIEDATLSPPYGDLLQPASASAGAVDVRGAVSLTKAKASKGHVELVGTRSPVVSGAVLQLYAGHPGQALKKKVGKPAGSKARFDVRYALGKGTWVVQLRYVASGLEPATSAKKRVTIR